MSSPVIVSVIFCSRVLINELFNPDNMKILAESVAAVLRHGTITIESLIIAVEGASYPITILLLRR